MLSKFSPVAVVAVAASSLVSAQTFTACNPLTKTCPADPAFGETVNCDFTKGACGAFQAAQGTTIKYDSQGAVFTINSEKDAPTIHTDKFIFFGEIEVEVQAAPGQGIVTSAVLQSDDLDEKPFVGIYKRIKIVDYAGKSEAATGGIKEYVYGDKTGAAKSIKVVQGKSDSKQVHGENGITGGEGKDNGSSSHNEAKSVLDDSSSTDASSATRRPSATSGGPLQTGTSTGDQGVKPKTTLATAAGGSNSTATARPSKGPDDTVPTSAAGRAVASLGALAVAAAFTALLL
ncbi:glycoside hydrolase family 16 protein [Ophiocordyceps sinensis CO18]|uniref:Glycoside hydrolase family 16 protein n=1 Tax=Ophiocordyceps sinensis (strain Co18 / CGMCC 3.14243) TaxID=911162 RepID=T5A8A1_OPHSC|nr:glycoside hydrolase family 16 protein [Ophiocordyceps sinensis CO18]